MRKRHYQHEPETRAALDLIFSDHFSRNEPGVFLPLRETLLEAGHPLRPRTPLSRTALAAWMEHAASGEVLA